MSNNVLLRVTQMNAVYLDNEVYKAFQNIVQQLTKCFPPGFTAPYDTELNLLTRLAILNYSVIKNGTTFGQQLLSIKYATITPAQKAMYVALNCLEYLRCRFKYWKPAHDINKIIFKIYMVIRLMDFLNFSIFLRNGMKPLLIERILGLSQVYATDNAARHFDSKYMARELLWNSFIEIIVYVLPLLNYHKLRRSIKNYNPFHKKTIVITGGNPKMTIDSKCSYCNKTPMLPHHMGCVHIFCYICLKGNLEADPRFECPVCEYTSPNMMCERVNAQ